MLELENIKALHIRSEAFAKAPGVAKSFEVVISRALSSMTSFALTAPPFLKKDGVIIAMRGNVSNHDIQLLRSSINKKHDMLMDKDIDEFEINVKRYSLPYLESNRSIVSLTYCNTLAY